MIFGMSDNDPAAKLPVPKRKKWTYGRPVRYQPPWKEILRPVIVTALAVYVGIAGFRMVTVGSPDQLRARTHALDIADMWEAACAAGAVEPEKVRDEREAIAFLRAGVGVEYAAWEQHVQLKLSNEDCEAALPFLKWQKPDGGLYKKLHYSHYGKE